VTGSLQETAEKSVPIHCSANENENILHFQETRSSGVGMVYPSDLQMYHFKVMSDSAILNEGEIRLA
jgi:hypothetical protein